MRATLQGNRLFHKTLADKLGFEVLLKEWHLGLKVSFYFIAYFSMLLFDFLS